MKKSTKIILGVTIPVVVLATVIPPVVIFTKKPAVEGELKIDVSQTDKHAWSWVERKFDYDGYCYIQNIKLLEGDVNSLSAEVLNVKGMDECKYDASIIPLEDNYFSVKVHFESQESYIGLYAPTFDVKIKSKDNKVATIKDCTVAFTENTVTISDSRIKANQTFYTTEASDTRSFFLKGSLQGHVQTLWGSKSIDDWSSFQIKCKVLAPTTAKITATIVQKGYAPYIHLYIENCPEKITSLPIELTLTSTEMPNWTCTLDEKLLTIEQTQDVSKFYEYELDTANHYAAVKDVHTFDDNLTIPEKVTVDSQEYTITSIKRNVFWDYINLKSIVFPNTLTTIEQCAFENCYELDNVTIPASVTDIDARAFRNCLSLTHFKVDDANAKYSCKIKGVESNCLVNKAGTELLIALGLSDIPDGITELGPYCFSYSANIKEITIPKTITKMYTSVFSNSSITKLTFSEENTSIKEIPDYTCAICKNLTEVEFNSNLTTINDCAFRDCSSLKKLDIKNNINQTWQYVFDGCTSLEEVNIGTYFHSMDTQPFSNCPNINKIIVSPTNSSYSSKNLNGEETYALLSKDSKTIIKGSKSFTGFYEGLTTITTYAFYGDTTLTSVVLPDSVTSIGSVAFCGCTNLSTFTIKNTSNLQFLGFRALDGCANLKEVYIPKTCTSIEKDCFSNCTKLEKVTFDTNSTLTAIPDEMFYGCQSLKDVTLPATLTSIGESSFALCYTLEEIALPETLTKINTGAFQWCLSLNKIIIPKTVTTMGNYVFGYCTSLKDVQIPSDSTLTSIGYSLFHACLSLETIVLPNGITELQQRTFENCSSLKSVTLPNALTKMGDGCFMKCTALETIAIPNTVLSIPVSCFEACFALKSVTLPSSLVVINVCAFYECGVLTSIDIPTYVKVIGQYAFSYCDKLESATFQTKEGWKYEDGTDVGISTDVAKNATILKDGYSIYIA